MRARQPSRQVQADAVPAGNLQSPKARGAVVRQAAEPPGDAVSDPRRWLRYPVSFDVHQYPLSNLLREFAALQGVSCQISEQLTGTVTGESKFSDPSEFLDGLSRAQYLNWYFDGTTVFFFSNAEMRSRLFHMKGGGEPALRAMMTELGLFDPRFAWRVADGGRILMVQGPEVYLTRIEELLASQSEFIAAAAQEKRLGVFRLKHAWAAERTITTGDAEVRVPGVADLLRQIVAGQILPSGSISTSPTPPGSPRFKKGTGIVARNRGLAAAREQGDEEQPPDDGGTAFIQADTRLNAVLVWDYEYNMPRHRGIIETLDQPLALVEIRAAIVDVETSRTRELGVSWEYLDNGGNWRNNAGSNVGDGLGRNGLDLISGSGMQYSTIYSRGLDQFMAKVSALEEDGGANILSRPSVLTQDNIQATLEHTETFYVRLEGEREVDLADVTTGMTLRVTPHVIDGEHGSGAIQLAVYIVNGTDSYDDNSSLVDNLPRVRQSTISTQAVVHEGEALVIGGYYNEVRSTNDSGVPGLKRIPGLGALFRSRGSTNTKSERLFILSPRIVYPGLSPIMPETEAERSFETSPAKRMLDGDPLPAFDEPRKKKPWWKRR